MLRANFLILIMLGFAQNTYAFGACRIQGYAHEIDCKTLSIPSPVSHQLIFHITVYKVAARVRYPKASPLFWLPDGIGLNPSVRAPTMIQSFSRIRNTRDLYWIAFSPVESKFRGDCGWPHLIQSVHFRLSRFENPNYLSNCQQQLQRLGSLSEVSSDTLAYYYEAVAKSLGIHQVTIFAERSGAHVAAAWHQKAPGRILFQVLDNPEDTYKKTHLSEQIKAFIQQLNSASTLCISSGQCTADYPGLSQQLPKLIAQTPVKLRVRNPHTFLVENISFSRSFLAASWLQMLQSPEQAQWLPSLTQRALDGDWMPMYQQFVKYWGRSPSDIQFTLLLAHQCIDWQNIQDKHLDNAKLINNAFETPNEKIIFAWMFGQLTQRYQRLCGEVPLLVKPHLAATLASPKQLILNGVHPLSSTNIDKGSQTIQLNLNGVGASALNIGCAKDVIARFFKIQDQSMLMGSNLRLNPSDIQADCLLSIPSPIKPRVAKMTGQNRYD